MQCISRSAQKWFASILQKLITSCSSRLLATRIPTEAKGVGYYEASARRYHEFRDSPRFAKRKGMPVSAMKKERQIEKDERFWTAACLLKLHMGGVRYWQKLLRKCFGDQPPLDG